MTNRPTRQIYDAMNAARLKAVKSVGACPCGFNDPRAMSFRDKDGAPIQITKLGKHARRRVYLAIAANPTDYRLQCACCREIAKYEAHKAKRESK